MQTNTDAARLRKRSVMRCLVAIMMFVGFVSLGSIGCSDTKTSTIKQETKIDTPRGTTTITTEKQVKKTGENPPADPAP